MGGSGGLPQDRVAREACQAPGVWHPHLLSQRARACWISTATRPSCGLIASKAQRPQPASSSGTGVRLHHGSAPRGLFLRGHWKCESEHGSPQPGARISPPPAVHTLPGAVPSVSPAPAAGSAPAAPSPTPPPQHYGGTFLFGALPRPHPAEGPPGSTARSLLYFAGSIVLPDAPLCWNSFLCSVAHLLEQKRPGHRGFVSVPCCIP